MFGISIKILLSFLTFEGVEANIQEKEECREVPVEEYQKLQWQRRVALPDNRVIVQHSQSLRIAETAAKSNR